MENWNSVLCAAAGGLLYIISSELLPEWSHWLVGIYAGVIFIAAYWIVPKKLKMWLRVSIAVAVAIAAAAIARVLTI